MEGMIIEMPYTKKLYGIPGRIGDKGAWDAGKPLMDKLWQDIKTYQRKSTGINYWYYYEGGSIFIGVELLDMGIGNAKLEFLDIRIPQYAYVRYTGPYNGMTHAYNELARLISNSGRKGTGNNLEIYGHDKGPNAPPEVEILISIL
jgi:effector-binding domain-containing protein